MKPRFNLSEDDLIDWDSRIEAPLPGKLITVMTTIKYLGRLAPPSSLLADDA